MYKAFNVKFDDSFANNMLRKYDAIKSKDYMSSFSIDRIDPIAASMLDAVFDVNELLTDKLEALVFPESKCDVFISHSHADKELAEGFAAWLQEELELSVFVDSRCWQHTDDVMRALKNQIGYRSWEKDRMEEILNMVLSGALMKAVDNCEAFFFLNTEHSCRDAAILDDKEHTESPWLYYELLCARLLRRRSMVKRKELSERRFVTDSVTPVFTFDASALIDLDSNMLCKWKCMFHVGDHKSALSTLYDIKSGKLIERRPLYS